MTDTTSDLYWDPYDTVIDAAPYEVWRRLRDEAPVYRNDRYDFYALSRFADVRHASTQPQRFSSAHVDGPTTPSARSPRAFWNATVAARLSRPNAPSTAPL